MKNAHDPKKMPKIPKEKKKKLKKEVVEQKKVETQLPPMQSIQVNDQLYISGSVFTCVLFRFRLPMTETMFGCLCRQ